MSASREKKNRQDLASQGIQDPKAIREAEEKAQQRKANRLYGTIAVVFVLVAALLVVVNSGVLERSATAITVDGENYTAAQMNYYYYGIKNSIINSGYSSFYGIDTSVAMDKQNMSDTAKMLLQVTDEGDITWDQFFRDYATRQLSVQVMAAKEAEANGMGEDDDIRAEVNEVIDSITAGAKEQGYTLKSYLKLAYGSTMTVSTFKKMMTLEEVATHYMQHYQDELSYTESQLEEYYQANSSDFDVASYEYIYFKGTADSTTATPSSPPRPPPRLPRPPLPRLPPLRWSAIRPASPCPSSPPTMRAPALTAAWGPACCRCPAPSGWGCAGSCGPVTSAA